MHAPIKQTRGATHIVTLWHSQPDRGFGYHVTVRPSPGADHDDYFKSPVLYQGGAREEYYRAIERFVN